MDAGHSHPPIEWPARLPLLRTLLRQRSTLLVRQETYCRVKVATATGLLEYPPAAAMARTCTCPGWVREKGP